MVAAPTLLDQLHGKVAELRKMHEQLQHGDLLREVVSQARDPGVWAGGPQMAFCGWLDAFDAWMRMQFADALGALRHRVESYVSAFDDYKLKTDNLIPGAVPPTPPAPVGSVPPSCPHPFVMQRTGDTNPKMNPDMMRRSLVGALGRAKDEVMNFSRHLDEVLNEPAPVPGMAPSPAPMRHLPPDAKEAAGIPNAYLAIATQLDDALRDVLTRAETWEQAMAADDSSAAAPSFGFGGLLKTASDLVERAREGATVDPLPQLTPEAEAPAPVQPPPEVQEAEAEQLVRDYPPKKVLEDPRKLQELARKLDEHGGQAAFSARFIEKFGADKFLEVPRTLQAWERRRVKMPGHTSPPNEKALPLDKVRDEPKEGEVEGILYAFSATLATTTTSEHLTDDQEETLDEIVESRDALALSWLLTDNEHVFDKEFLLRSFDHVKKSIEDEARDAANLVERVNYATGPITGRDGQALSPDLKMGILNAISRNPEAALELTNMKFKPIEIPVFGKKPDKVDNPVDLLYRHGTYEDKGAALGRMVRSSHDQLQQLADKAGRETEEGKTCLRRANEITLRMAHEAAYGREEIDRIVVGLAPILAAQHMDDLQASVVAKGEADFGLGKSVQEAADQALVVGKAGADKIHLSGKQVEDLLTAVCVDPEAERIFGEGLAKHQARIITESLAQQDSAGEADWAMKLGLLNGKYVNAAGNHAMGEFAAAEARRAQQLAIFDTVVALAPVVGGALHATAAKVIGGVLQYGTLPVADFEQMVKDIHFVAPSRDAVLNQIDNFEAKLEERLTASLGAIALETGLLGDRMAVKAELEAGMRAQAEKDDFATISTFFDENGHIMKPSDLNDEQSAALNQWLLSDKVVRVIGPALNDYKLAMLGQIKDR